MNFPGMVSCSSVFGTMWMLGLVSQALGQETLPPLGDTNPPETHEELWGGYDPGEEPLDVEILKEWKEEGVVMKVVRYRIGIFKGEKAMMAAVYGYPEGAESLPGLVQIHGGGQYADYQAVLANAKRGYATISIAWAGRINAPDYRVTPKEVQLFWDGATDDPHYKVTTDWGALDGYHAPARNPKNIFPLLPEGAAWTLDPVKSPRNNGWFLCALGARRALTFLEQQAEVDPERLGVYGHSMGGKLTVMTAGADGRVKAAAPSCGGTSDRYNDDPVFRATLGDVPALRKIACPVVFLSPSNDFHGRINDLPAAVTDIQSKEWRVTCSPHHNHKDTAEYEVATQLWFDEHLKEKFSWPKTPQAVLELRTASGVPEFSVQPDSSKEILAVDVYYTQHGQDDGQGDDRRNTIARHWHCAVATEKDGRWLAALPVLSTEKPLWVYANVSYPLDAPVSGAGYYYGLYTTDRFNLSSLMSMVSAEELSAAGVKATKMRSLLIESFEGRWEKEWFSYRPAQWPIRTHKVYDAQWAAPEGAKLAFQVRSVEENMMVVGLDGWAAEISLKGGGEWESVVLAPEDFLDVAEKRRSDWSVLRELRLGDQEILRTRNPDRQRKVGGVWKGKKPTFRNLRWLKGTGGGQEGGGA